MKRGGLVFIAGGLASFYCKIGEYFRGFEFSRLDDARSGSALTVSLRLGHTRVLTAVQGCHSLPSCRFATSKAVIHCRARSNPCLPKGKGGFEFSRLDDARSGSALMCQRARHSLPSPFESHLPKRKEHLWCSFLFGLPWGIRTPNRQNRNLILYPIALRADEIPCGILSFF